MQEAKEHDGVGADLLAEYAKIVESAELVSVVLTQLNFEVQPVYYSARQEVTLGYEIEVDEQQYEVETGRTMAFIGAKIAGEIHDDDDDKSNDDVIFTEAKYIVSYQLASGCNVEAVKKFVERVAVFACYPYFRSLVANIDWAASTGMPPMPVHRERTVRNSEVENEIMK